MVAVVVLSWGKWRVNALSSYRSMHNELLGDKRKPRKYMGKNKHQHLDNNDELKHAQPVCFCAGEKDVGEARRWSKGSA